MAKVIVLFTVIILILISVQLFSKIILGEDLLLKMQRNVASKVISCGGDKLSPDENVYCKSKDSGKECSESSECQYDCLLKNQLSDGNYVGECGRAVGEKHCLKQIIKKGNSETGIINENKICALI